MTGFLGKNNIFYANYLDARKASQGYQKVLADDLFEQYANKIGLDLSNAEKVAKVRAKTDAAAAQQVTAQAARTAEMQTLAYVDNPDIRSQASVVLRNIIPFGRAQEEFYRRWGRTIRHNPDAIRRLQMLNEGAHHSGFIQKDEEGNDIFIYPASRPTQELMYRLGKLRGWNWAMSPVPYQMSSQVRFLNQGMDPKNILPSFGPVAAIPMKSVEKVLPESVAVRSFNRRVLGDQAANQKNPFASVLPTFARRLYESGIFGNDSEQLASAMKQSAVYLEMAGRTPPEGADPGVIEAHEDDLRTWARVHLFMRAIFGTVAPASPQEFGAASGAPIGDHTTDDPAVFLAQHQLIDAFRQKGLPTVSSEFRAEVARLLPQHGPGAYDVALANWVRTRPDQLPFTVGTSEAEFGGFIPATKAAGDFFDNNRALFKNYRAAAVLFLPQSEGEFSLDVHRAQMGAGLRKKKDFEEFALDLKLVGNLQTYYDQKEAYAAKRAEAKAAGNLDAARAIDAAWTDAAKRIKLTHPALGQYLDNYQERQNNRNRVMSELSSMIENNDMPDIPGRQAIAMMVDAYQKRQSALAQLAPQRTDEANAAKAAIKSSFQDYVKRVAATDLNADMVYQRLLRGLEED
jgi:hypothetical protein